MLVAFSRQAIILGINFNGNWNKIQPSLYNEINLNMSPAKRRAFCLGLIVLRVKKITFIF